MCTESCKFVEVLKKIRFILLSLITAVVASCGGGGTSVENYSEALYSPEYAIGFEILGAKGGKSSILVTKTPWQGSDSTAASQIFVQRGDEPVPTGFSGQVLRGDARRVVCMSSSYIAMLDAMGEVSRVVGVSGMGFVSNAIVLAGRDSIGDVGYDGNIDYEKLIALSPDIVLLYGVTGANMMEGKLRELGIPFAYIGEYLEESPLGKAEWLVAMAELIGKRAEGMEVFKKIPERYNELKRQAQAMSTKPKVMLNTPYGDSWVMPSTGSYIAQLISDAGGQYIYTKNTSTQSMPIDLEEAYKLASESDIWMNVGQLTAMAELKRLYPKFADTKPVVTNQVWNCNLRATQGGGNDFWESGVVRPDCILQDLIMMFHPEAAGSADYTYYKKLE